MSEDPPKIVTTGFPPSSGVHPAPAHVPDVAEPLHTPESRLIAAPILDVEEVLGAEAVDEDERPVLDDQWFEEADAYEGDKLVREGTKRGIVDIYEDEAGEWRFRVKGGNGEIVAASEGYVSAENAARGFATLQAICAGKLTRKINGEIDDGTE